MSDLYYVSDGLFEAASLGGKVWVGEGTKCHFEKNQPQVFFCNSRSPLGMVNKMWLDNPCEAQVSAILVPCEFKLSLWGRAGCY